MEPGIISNLITYYRDHPNYRKDNEWAWRDFFGAGYQPTEEEMGWFVEWYLFEFRLRNGKTILEEHAHKNPLHESEDLIELYRNLSEAELSIYEVLRIDVGTGLFLRNVQTSEEVEVKERSATYQVKKGKLMMARVARVGDHFEIVGSSYPMLDTGIGDGLREHFQQTKEKLSMRDVLWLMQRAESESEFDDPEMVQSGLVPERHIDPHEAEKRLASVLRRLRMDGLVDVATVRGWVVRCKPEDRFVPCSMALGLLPPNANRRKMNQLMSALNDLINVTPLESLGGRSSQEAYESEPNRERDYVTDRILFGINCCGDEMDEAFGLMKACKFRQAARVYGRVFQKLLKHQTVLHEVYRAYANKATAHYYCSEYVLGDAMLKIALELNPNYDFAIDLAKKTGFEFDAVGDGAKKRKIPKSVERDAGYIYYRYLMPFGINFFTEKMTKTPRTNIKLTE